MYIEKLTRRENDVAQLLILGYTSKKIADKLGISFHTAKLHVCRIIKKLGAVNRTHAAYILGVSSN
ncbi:helix-turn-helix transcriptional regulator [bacterium]|nr:helix-turn-helix transcriptional regulator [bacterium]